MRSNTHTKAGVLTVMVIIGFLLLISLVPARALLSMLVLLTMLTIGSVIVRALYLTIYYWLKGKERKDN